MAVRRTLHEQITRELAVRVIAGQSEAFPNEAALCAELGVSRTVLRESMKVLVDKGMVEMRPRSGTRARPRSEWRLLDPDILAWQAELNPDSQFLRDLCEVRLAIEPTAAGFAAIRADEGDIRSIERCLRTREALTALHDIVNTDLEFHARVVAASHNPLLAQLSETLREPLRTALALTLRLPASVALGFEAQQDLCAALKRRDPMAARRAADQAVGLAMIAIEEVIQQQHKPRRVHARTQQTL